MRTLRLALAQTNPTVGDLDGNTSSIIEFIDQARLAKADLVAFPELAITGYPPEDLLFKPQFIQDNIDRMHQIVKATTNISVVVGFVDAKSDIYNAAAIINNGELIDVYHKVYLPNYGVFDEERYFKSGNVCPVYVINGTHVGVNICEDIWHSIGPTEVQRESGAEVIVNINGSPYHMGKPEFREKMLATRASDNELFIAYVNMVGGQDELVFDGNSSVFDPDGITVAQAVQFDEQLLMVDLDVESVFRARPKDTRRRKQKTSVLDKVGLSSVKNISCYTETSRSPVKHTQSVAHNECCEIYAALVTGTRDYVRKCGFERVLVALSGGIDSSIVATIAVDAIGADNVAGVAMPSRYSSDGSLSDAKKLAQNLGINLMTIPIEPSFSASLDSLLPNFDNAIPSLAEENLQSRIRGLLIMALSNRPGWLVLTTGNKSEMAVGYATIYGDMAGGYAVIKDVPKTLVYRLAKYRNCIDRELIPETVITKAPSAELRPDQKDQDSLPPYDILDPILKAYVEDDLSYKEILALGFDAETVTSTIRLVDRSEYKRRQAPPGIKITPRNFGRDRRMPIANRYSPF